MPFKVFAGQPPVKITKENKIIRGAVVLTKKETEKSDKFLAGAVFELRTKDGTVIKRGLTTDETGQITVENLVPGEYEFVETEAPAGYTKLTAPINFEVTAEQLKEPGSTITLAPIENEKIVVVVPPGTDVSPTPDPTKPTTPVKPSTPVVTPPSTNVSPSTPVVTTRPSTPTVTAGPTYTNSSVQQQSRLPQTSAGSTIWASLFGSLLIAAASMVLVARRRRG